MLRAAFMLNDDAYLDLLRQWIAASVRLTDTQRLADSTVLLAMLTLVQG